MYINYKDAAMVIKVKKVSSFRCTCHSQHCKKKIEKINTTKTPKTKITKGKGRKKEKYSIANLREHRTTKITKG